MHWKTLGTLSLLAPSLAFAQLSETEADALNDAMMCQAYVNFLPRVSHADHIAMGAEEQMNAILASVPDRDLIASAASDAAFMQVQHWSDTNADELRTLGEACYAEFADRPAATPPERSFSDQQLQQFATALKDFALVTDAYNRRLEAAESESAQQAVRREANEKMLEAAQQAGLDRETFNALFVAIEQDAELMQRLERVTQPAKPDYAYKAIISCGMRGNHINVLACFEETDLKVEREGRTTVYKIYDLHRAGVEHADGLHIELPSSFTVTAQNSHEHLVLGIQILDPTGKVVYEDQAGMWGTMIVSD